jgi:hypothetical protein
MTIWKQGSTEAEQKGEENRRYATSEYCGVWGIRGASCTLRKKCARLPHTNRRGGVEDNRGTGVLVLVLFLR